MPRAEWPGRLALVTLIVAAVGAVSPAGAAAGGSLRFFGNGVAAPGADRGLIPVDPATPADVGATSFTIELWLRAPSADTANPAPRVACGANVRWIEGNIVLDRDRYNRDRKYGLSLAGGRVVFGVSGDGTGDRTICGRTDLRDGRWHHVAVERRRSDGQLWLFVDGRLERTADGPDGDISYPDGAAPGLFCGDGDDPCVNDPYLVLGAEKHDAGPAYPSFSGWIDELRISRSIRYTAPFTPRRRPFTPDAKTVLLYHLDATSGTRLKDASGAAGGPTHGRIVVGGDPAGPRWSEASPFD
jgi:hypothetical protein